jgi:1,5-anhydro-D-fructose reductase (1,5-anhydro-D-mannitol-forming)
MGRIKYGIIGFGGIAENRIAKEGFGCDTSRFQGNSGAVLIAATDINPARRQAAEALGLTWYNNTGELLEKGGVESVFIASSNSSHAEIAKQALSMGKHCIIEKPITHTMETAFELQELARASGLSLSVDHMMTKNNLNIKARETIAEGGIGGVNDLTLHMEFLYGSTEEEALTWRCNKPAELGGPLGDVGCHCLYMAEFLLNDKITEIACTYTPRTLDIMVENGAFIQFKTSSNISGSVRVAFNQPRGGLLGTLSNLGFEVYGSEGVIRSYGTLFQLSGHDDEPVKIRLEIQKQEGTVAIGAESYENIYQKQILDHVASIKEGPLLDGSDAIHNMKLLFACLESADGSSEFVKI